MRSEVPLSSTTSPQPPRPICGVPVVKVRRGVLVQQLQAAMGVGVAEDVVGVTTAVELGVRGGVELGVGPATVEVVVAGREELVCPLLGASRHALSLSSVVNVAAAVLSPERPVLHSKEADAAEQKWASALWLPCRDPGMRRDAVN